MTRSTAQKSLRLSFYWQGLRASRPFVRRNFAEYGGFTAHLGFVGVIVRWRSV